MNGMGHKYAVIVNGKEWHYYKKPEHAAVAALTFLMYGNQVRYNDALRIAMIEGARGDK